MSELPYAFVERIKRQYTDAKELLAALDEQPPVSVRINPKKNAGLFDTEKRVDWCEQGRYLAERPVFTLDPLFHAGAYYPQEAGSMFIDFVLKQIELPAEPVCLDLCAAPGGKSTLLLSHLNGRGLLVANELIRNRAQVLRENIVKWGSENAIVTNNEAADFGAVEAVFDLVLVDAPCSGEGMFRKDLNARSEWTEANAANCVVRQADILEDIWPSLKKGGYLLYSTCTFNPEENDVQLRQFLEKVDATVVALEPNEKWGLFKNAEGIGFSCLPHKMKTEGFYFALLRKNEGVSTMVQKKAKRDKKKSSKPIQLPDVWHALGNNGYHVNAHLDYFYAITEQHKELATFFLHNFKCMKWGVRLGTIIGNNVVPDFEWALSTNIPCPYPSAEVDKSTALNYLKGEPIVLDAPKGWLIIKFRGLPLGWVKNLGNRVNNYYPKEFRIRMSIR